MSHGEIERYLKMEQGGGRTRTLTPAGKVASATDHCAM